MSPNRAFTSPTDMCLPISPASQGEDILVNKKT